ncbi:peptidase MA family metallohydrolase [Chloroflexota bacterium]
MIKYLGIIVLAVFLSGLIPGPVQAQDEISASTTVEASFPESLTFHLKANLSPVSSAVITSITLRYKIEKITTVTVVSEVEPEFDPGPVVETSWELDMRKVGLPPGAEVSFQWIVEDAFGHILETPWETVTFNDERYSWEQWTEDKVSLFWYQGSRDFAQGLFDATYEALDRLAQDVGVYLEQPVKIYIYASPSDLKGALIYPEEWTGGLVFIDYGIIAIGVPPGDLAWGKRALAHELCHLVIHQMTFNPYGDLPLWLDEGLAGYAEGAFRSEYQYLLDKAVSEGSLISVQSLSSNFPADSGEANLSYAQSYSVVEFLIRDYGKERMLQLLDVFKEGSSYDKALMEVYGFDTGELDALWRASLGLEPRPTPTPLATIPTPSSSPAVTPAITPAPTPKAGGGCAASSGSSSSGVAMLGALGVLLLLPTTAEAIHLRSRNKRKQWFK